MVFRTRTECLSLVACIMSTSFIIKLWKFNLMDLFCIEEYIPAQFIQDLLINEGQLIDYETFSLKLNFCFEIASLN